MSSNSRMAQVGNFGETIELGVQHDPPFDTGDPTTATPHRIALIEKGLRQ
jgi:hypothetical protein